MIIGIDDAGRGPLIGSMFLAGVLVNEAQNKDLKEEGVADSKTLSHSTRVKLSGKIKDISTKFHIVSSSPDQIDHSLASGVNLNTLEAIKAAEIINTLSVGVTGHITVVVDCPSVNTVAWKATLVQYLKRQDLEVKCEHKADANHPSVSAASILAKVAREDSLIELKNKFGDFGSGYPSDPTTSTFLKKNGKKYAKENLFRKSWATYKALFPEANQKQLEL